MNSHLKFVHVFFCSPINQFVLVCVQMFCSRAQYVWFGRGRWEEVGNGLGSIGVTKCSIWQCCVGIVCLLYSPLFCTSVVTQASFPLSPFSPTSLLCHVTSQITLAFFSLCLFLDFQMMSFESQMRRAEKVCRIWTSFGFLFLIQLLLSLFMCTTHATLRGPLRDIVRKCVFTVSRLLTLL